jgi:uncharacterized spore protein YtfJ
MNDVPFDPATVVRMASDILTVKRVFGDPIERNGVTIIPVAKVMGGSGGGGGHGEGPQPAHEDPATPEMPAASGSGGGSGLGIHVRPVGVYVVDDDGVHWRPALDLNRAIIGGQIVVALAVLALARALRRRR